MYSHAMEALLGRPEINDPQIEFDKIKEKSSLQVKLRLTY